VFIFAGAIKKPAVIFNHVQGINAHLHNYVTRLMPVYIIRDTDRKNFKIYGFIA